MRARLFQSVRKLVCGEKKMTDKGQELMMKGGRRNRWARQKSVEDRNDEI